MGTETKVKVRVTTRLAGITAAAETLGINRCHLQKCMAGKRKAGKKTLAAMRQMGLVKRNAGAAI